MDKYSNELMKLISTINFCRYITIFFPFSMQLFPDTFPGEDPKDCPRDISKAKAVKIGCKNAQYPDMYNHYREVKFVQIKHHWYWKLHMIFNGISCLADKESNVLLLEEDYYVLPDALHVMDLMVSIATNDCPSCKAISLGNYESSTDYLSQSSNAIVRQWVSSKNNLGMVVTRNFYENIAKCNDNFCEYDDYNWDWTLQAVSPQCLDGPLVGVSLEASRVLHIGTCNGVHIKGGSKNCNAKQLAESALKRVDESSLFPSEIKITSKSLSSVRKPIINGGWGDVRDHRLCKSYLSYSKMFLKNVLT